MSTSVSDSQSSYIGKTKIVPWYLALSAIFYYSFVIEPISIVFYIIFYAIPLLYVALNLRTALRLVNALLVRNLRMVVYLFLILIAMSLLIPVVHNTGDWSYLAIKIGSILKYFIKISFLLIIFIKYISPSCDVRLFIRYFVLATCCYVVGSFFFILFPESKDFWMSVVADGERARESAVHEAYVTRYGWSGFSGFDYTFKCTLALILSLFLLSENIKQVRFIDFLPSLIVIIGNVMYGRIGLVTSAIVLFGYGIFVLMRFRPKMTVKVLVLASILLPILFIIVANNKEMHVWFTWAFGVFISFFSTGTVEDGSVRMLFNNMYFVPPLDTIMWGDGKYTEPDGISYYMETDVGFLRPLLFGGIIFEIIYYAIAVYLLMYLYKQNRDSNKLTAFLMAVALGITLFIFELKGEMVTTLISILLPVAILYSAHNMYLEER